jgi:hypothetical protein
MAWPEIEALKRLLADGIRLCACDPDATRLPCSSPPCEVRQIKVPHSGTTVVLREQEATATLTEVYISGIPTDGFLLKLDACGIHFWKANTLNKLCDYVILTERHGQKYAIFIDLKSSLPRNPQEDTSLKIVDKNDLERVWQFNGGSLLFDYMAVGVAFHGGAPGLTTYKKCFFELYTQIKSIQETTSTGPIPFPNQKVQNRIRTLRHKCILTRQISNAGNIPVNELIDAWDALPASRYSTPSKVEVRF